MTREKFARLYLNEPTTSTVATRPITEHNKREARTDRGMDWHVNQATERE